MDNYLTENIDTVIFDIGNVLIHFAWEDYLHDLGYEGAMFDRVADAVFRSDDWDKGDSGLYTTQEWLDSFIENDPEIEGDIRKVFEGFGASIVPYPVTERWLSYIREKGMKMYYLSNYSDEMYCQSEEQLSFLKTFDGGVFSWREKCMKPDPKIYEILLKRYKIVPEQALFFDDRLENVEGARKVGINGVVFNTDIPLQMLEK